MTTATALFYVFSLVLLFAAFRVITARSPVYAALYLVLAFFSAACVWILLRAEFLAIALVLVYVGAVMVLFLFVVMMLDVDFAVLRQGSLQYLPIGALVGFVFVAELLLVVGVWMISPHVPQSITAPINPNITNTEALGRVLYTQYVYYFQAAGVVLLVAMIGAIVLTLRHKPNVRRQNISDQVARTPKTAIEIRRVRPGQGV